MGEGSHGGRDPSVAAGSFAFRAFSEELLGTYLATVLAVPDWLQTARERTHRNEQSQKQQLRLEFLIVDPSEVRRHQPIRNAL